MGEKAPLPTNVGGLHGTAEEAFLGEEIVKDVKEVAEKPSQSLKQETKPTIKKDEAKLGNFFVRSFQF